MLVRTLVIDLGWGKIRSALAKLPDSGFVAKQEATAHRQTLVDQYIAAFRHVESSARNDAKIALTALSTDISARVMSEQRGALLALVDSQLAKLS